MRKGFSELVIDYRKKKRLALLWRAISVIILLSFAAFLFSRAYADYRYRKMASSPDWGGFVINLPNGDIHKNEWVSGENSDGVPNTLYINGQEWSVTRVDAFKDALDHKNGESFHGVQAETSCEHHSITYITGNDQRRLKIRLMHEVFHAGACEHGGDDWWNSEANSENHPGIYHLGEFMSLFAHDNPTFMSWESQ